MEVDVNKQTITINRLISHQNQTVTIEGDMIVPDVKPDILNVVHTTGNVCLYKKEIQDGKIKLEGGVPLYVLYLADSDQDRIRSLNTTIEFSKNLSIDACRVGMNLRSIVHLQNIECKVLNERKLNIKMILQVELWIYSNEDISILKEINNIEGIQTLQSSMQINHLIGSGNCKVSAKDTIHIEGETLAEILKTDIQVCNQEMKVSYNKILMKADVNAKIMYLTEKGNIQVVAREIPVMGFLDMNQVAENNLINSYYDIKNISIQPDPLEQNSISVDIELEINCDVSDSVEIELIQDMYSPVVDIQFKSKKMTTIMNKQLTKQMCSIQERMEIPEIMNHQIYDVEVDPFIEKTEILNGKIMYEGNLLLQFIFSSDTSAGLETQAYRLPFTFAVEKEQINPTTIVNTRVFVAEKTYKVEEGQIDCNVQLQFTLETYQQADIFMIDEITMQDNAEKTNPSMTIYLVKEGDTLWKIAKKYKTTIEQLKSMNSLENESILHRGQKIFIPRYSASTMV